MKLFKRKLFSVTLSFLLGGTAIVSDYSTMLLAKEPDTGSNEEVILWQESFEENQDDFVNSLVDEQKGSKNVNRIKDEETIEGNVMQLVNGSSFEASKQHNNTEIVDCLFDGSTDSKYLSNANVPSVDNPIWVKFALTQSITINRYQIASANDSPERDPESWKLYGSVDGKVYELIDEQNGIVFNERFERKTFEIVNPKKYQYFRLDIIKNQGDNGMTQFSEFALGSDEELPPEVEQKGMTTKIVGGPISPWVGASGVGYSGKKSLEVSGIHYGKERGYSYNKLYDLKDQNIVITNDTKLDYMIFPDLINERDYDYNYTQMHMAVDIKFTDGTYLSDLKALDDHGNIIAAMEQGDSRTLVTKQWNHVSGNIGKVALGKTVDSILVDYDNDKNDQFPEEKDRAFRSYIDDIRIYQATDPVYEHLADYVNILRGTNDSPAFSRGLNVPAVTMPHGFNFWVPSNTSVDGRGRNTYTYQANGNYFRHMTISHEASNWVGDRGTWQFMINTSIDPQTGSFGENERKIPFSHEKEVARVYYYGIEFPEGTNASNTKMELTPTDHGAVVRFTFPKDAQHKNVIFDSINGSDDGSIIEYDMETNSFKARTNHTSYGLKDMYIYGTFDKPMTYTRTANNRQGIASFEDEVVEMKVATSFISFEQAKHNIELEINDNDFNTIYDQALKTWDDKLDVVEVEGGSYDQKVSLYSNMYRMFMYPNLLSENTGTNENPVWKYSSPYGGSNEKPEVVEGKMYYNNGFWDTYRAAWPAYSIFSMDKSSELLNGLVQHYKDTDWVPRWSAPGGTYFMSGTSSDIVFADAMKKGIAFDQEGAFKSMIKNGAVVSDDSNYGRKQLSTAIFRGYTSKEQDTGFSWSMEGYNNDYGISEMARELGYEDEAVYYANRAMNYVNLFDKQSDDVNDMWFKGKDAAGNWYGPSLNDVNTFDPRYWGDNYDEANAYVWSVGVTYDGQGLANLYGGCDKLAEKLDTIFETKGEINGFGADMDGYGYGHKEPKEAREVKMGQYNQSNQPAYHIIYMYNYAGQPWKTQKYVRDSLDRCFIGSEIGQGMIGDEDNGAGGAWYVFSALGFYPIMGTNEYMIGSPIFDKAIIHLDNGKDITITANGNSKENVYIQNVTLNGESYNKNYLTHEDLINGADIVMNMSNTPSSWGSSIDSLPTSVTKDDQIANPKEDITSTKVKEVDKIDGDVYLTSMTTKNIENAKNLFDNTSDTVATLSQDTSELIYSFTKPQFIDMLTLTSSKDSKAPEGFKVYGSNDAKSWQLLEERANLEFEWGRYTRPFVIHEADEFKHYKLELIGGEEISEIELFSQLDEFEKITLEDLKNLVTYSESLDLSSVHIEIIKNIDQKLAIAREVINQEAPDEEAIEEAYYGLQDALDKIDSNRLAYDKQEAETYDKNSGIVNDGPNIGSLNPGDWVCYKNVIFDSNANFFELYYSAETITQCGNPLIEVRLDSVDNEPIVTFVPNKTGTWKDYVYGSKKFESTQNITGIHDVYLTFSGEILPAEVEGLPKQNVANIDWFSFSEIITPTVTAQNGIITNENLDVKYGEDLVITFTPEEGYVFDQVLVDGQVYDGKVENNSITLVNVKKAHQVEVIFKLIDYKEADKTALSIAIDLANAITDKDLEKVIPVVANEFKAARDEANAVYNNASATQDEVNNAFDRLASVMQKLEFFKGDKTALKAFIDKVAGLDSSKYTETTWTAFEAELTEASVVYNDENAMQEEVNTAYSELVTAFLNLRLIPDKSLLEELINQANGLNVANYTKASFDGLTKALDEAKVVFDNPDATQKEVDSAKDVLAKALAGLQTVTTDNTVKTPVNKGDTTVSVKTGDESLAGMLAGLALLSVAGYAVLRRKED